MGWLGIFYLMDIFHVVYKVICAPPPILLVLHLNDHFYFLLSVSTFCFLRLQLPHNIYSYIIRLCGKLKDEQADQLVCISIIHNEDYSYLCLP